jgi:hypothetical protein
VSQIRDGAVVAYVGDDARTGLNVNDQGKVLMAEGSASHVKFATGPRAGDIVFLPNFDLVAVGKDASKIDESVLEGLQVTAAAEIFATTGASGILEALDGEGHLAVLDVALDDVLAFLAQRVRQDPAFAAVLAQLDDYEGDAVVHLACTKVLHQASRAVA